MAGFCFGSVARSRVMHRLSAGRKRRFDRTDLRRMNRGSSTCRSVCAFLSGE
jgi:hypothetical protein